MMKKKILHLITHLGIGGAQDNTLLTVEKCDRTRFDVHLASNPNGKWINRAKETTPNFHSIPNLVHPIHPFKDALSILDLVRLFRQEQFDIVHTHSTKAGIVGRWAAHLAKVPVIVHTIHGFAFHDFMPAWKRQLYINLELCATPCTDFFITVSELNRKEAIDLNIVKYENSQTVYSGIDFSKLDRFSEPSQTRQKLHIPEDYKVIVMVGRLDKQKAPNLLIDAFNLVVEKLPKTLLLLVGDGELKYNLQQQVSKLGISQNVKFLGSREDIPEILKVSDIFALSSLWEGLGRAMTEAMLLGKPVVVPNIYGIPEIVHHNETGLLFDAKNIEQIATHLIHLLQHSQERERLGKNAQQLTRKLFDANVMVAQIEEIYTHLLQTRICTKNELNNSNSVLK
ncbi:MAG: glycosyltransferase family 4 protein [Calothrix sp. C42_A2020_038]|nr:glycosyltransferase family 4 protein [Calothrix sp. C42_A2020_038]